MAKQKFKPTMRVSGKKAIDITIKYAVYSEDLAVFITAAMGPDFHGSWEDHEPRIEEFKAAVRKAGKTKLIQVAKRIMESDGTITPHYSVGDDAEQEKLSEAIQPVIEEIFEF